MKKSSVALLAGTLTLLGAQSALAEKAPASSTKAPVEKVQEGACGEGKCGATGKKVEKAKEGACGEGKCGAADSKTKKAKSAEGKCGEGKCGG